MRYVGAGHGPGSLEEGVAAPSVLGSRSPPGVIRASFAGQEICSSGISQRPRPVYTQTPARRSNQFRSLPTKSKGMPSVFRT